MKNSMLKKLNFMAIVALIVMTLIPLSTSASEINVTAEDLPTTGFEDSGRTTWTSLDEEAEFLQEVAEKSDRVRVTQEGTSVEGRPIYLVRVGNPLLSDEEIAEGRTIFVMGTPHGNEPAGREMALETLRDLAFSNDPETLNLLDKATILFTPTPNPDGRHANIRQNAWGLDNNRDNLNLTSPENQFIARVLNTFNPDITVDAHERGGTDPIIEYMWPRNLNVDQQLHDLNVEMVEEHLMPDVEADGFSTGYYGTPGGAGGEDERILRNMGALRNGLSLLTETGRALDPHVRVDAQKSTIKAVFKFYQDRYDEIIEVVDGAGERRAADGIDPSVPFYFDGADNWPPTMVVEKKPMGYLLTGNQATDVSRHFELFSIANENVDNGVFVTMNQPMMTVIPLLFDGRAKYNEIEALPLYSSLNPGTAANMTQQVAHFNNIGAFEDQSVFRMLNMHLTAVDQFEQTNQADKVVKHMESFKLLLNHQQDMMLDEAYDNLSTYADFLLDKWQ